MLKFIDLNSPRHREVVVDNCDNQKALEKEKKTEAGLKNQEKMIT